VIDLTSTRRKFYDKLREKLETTPDFNQLLLEKNIELRIEYKSRG
jgi:hypothetical protein